MIKSFLRKLVTSGVRVAAKSKTGLYTCQKIVEEIMGRTRSVHHRGHEMIFTTPNWLNNYRAETFTTKEPETLEWIESMGEGSVVWDIGANVGLYSIYAAKEKKSRVYAFEPSVFNLELLARNIFLNKLQHTITIVPIALSDGISENLFRMSSTQWGGALSTFGEDLDQNGKPFKEVFEYRTIGISMDDVHPNINIPLPQHIKIDVDGIEHFILRGGSKVLAQVESLLIEINDDFTDQAQESMHLLEKAGLVVHRKCFLGVLEGLNQYNYWWVRKKA